MEAHMKIPRPKWTLLIAVAAIAATVITPLGAQLVYEREAILHGELWRLLTGHLVHFNGRHLFYDLLAFGAAGILIEARRPRAFLLLCLTMASTIGLTLLLTQLHMHTYGGLSGLACGAFCYLALMGLHDNGLSRYMSMLILMALPLKIAAELWTGTSLLTYTVDSPFIAMPLSHAAGVVTAGFNFLSQAHSPKSNLATTKNRLFSPPRMGH
jgi:rhomboid family GlyGly-CTERM serine protease